MTAYFYVNKMTEQYEMVADIITYQMVPLFPAPFILSHL